MTLILRGYQNMRKRNYRIGNCHSTVEHHERFNTKLGAIERKNRCFSGKRFPSLRNLEKSFQISDYIKN